MYTFVGAPVKDKGTSYFIGNLSKSREGDMYTILLVLFMPSTNASILIEQALPLIKLSGLIVGPIVSFGSSVGVGVNVAVGVGVGVNVGSAVVSSPVGAIVGVGVGVGVTVGR